jgi:sigma-B regulation protein RsbU (phosphoserine phosphatase)
VDEVLHQIDRIGELQRRFLPRTLPQLPGWQWTGYHRQGRWPGGDYYNLLTRPDGRLAVFLGDASDQGATSTAMVAMVHVLLRACPLSSGKDRSPYCPFDEPILQPPHVLLGHLNHVLVENSLEEQFMTAFSGVLDPADGLFHYADAGHPAPRWWRAKTKSVEALPLAPGYPLGLDADSTYHRRWIEIQPGDALIFMSDGLVAGWNPQGKSLGLKRLDQIIAESAGEGANAVKAAIVSEWEEMLDDQTPADDMTLLVLERLP